MKTKLHKIIRQNQNNALTQSFIETHQLVQSSHQSIRGTHVQPIFYQTKPNTYYMKADRRLVTAIIILVGLAAVYTIQIRNPKLEPEYTYQVIKKYPHDPTAFTQGLVVHEGVFYEGTGLYGESSLRIIQLTTGEITQSISLPDEYFGEGVTILNSRIYQVTWRQNIGFIYTLNLEQTGNFTLTGEGWGLTTDGEYLILSDGTSTLSFIDPETLTTSHTVTVTFDEKQVTKINELEYIDDMVYANIWQTDMIAIIEPETGIVASWIDLTGLSDELDTKDSIDVLNGIAYYNEKLYVTGKRWPNLFEIKLVPK